MERGGVAGAGVVDADDAVLRGEPVEERPVVGLDAAAGAVCEQQPRARAAAHGAGEGGRGQGEFGHRSPPGVL
ncbi:hypothetical protein GCM10018987_14410 [Streptomyces cremeus]